MKSSLIKKKLLATETADFSDYIRLSGYQ